MSTWRPEDDVLISDSEDEDTETYRQEHYGREAMLFVIDANLYENPERFTEALSIIRSAFISGMLVNDKELMGVVFANTEFSPDPYEPGCVENISVPRNCAVFLPLRQLTKAIVEHYLRFENMAAEEFGSEYGVAVGGGSFPAMIRLCLNLFDNCSYKVAFAKIVYLTDRTMPHPPQTYEYENALLKAKDLEGREVDFYVIPMIDEFDYDPFYKEFLTLSKDVELDGFTIPDAKQLREILTERKLKKNFRKRSMGHFKFSIGPNLDISAQYYQFHQRRSYPRKVTLLRKDNSELERKYTMMVRKLDSETEEFVQEHQIKVTGGWYEINLGDMPIRITPERMNRVRNLHSPGMMLLGFKNLDDLPKNWYYMPCNFMYPDDNIVVGSKRLFRSLWERCYERKKIAICLFMRKRKSIPRYVALKPISAADNEAQNSFIALDGFKIIYLPFAKHIRHIDFSEWNSIENTSSEEGVGVFDKVIKKLKIKYEPELIVDPVLEGLQSKLIAMAFDIRVEGSNLKEVANPEKQDERIAKLLPDIERLFGDDPETAAKKRSAPGQSGSAPKVAKLTEDDVKSFEKVQSVIKSQTLNTCTVAQLRTILSEHFDATMPKSANKQSLIDRIYELA